MRYLVCNRVLNNQAVFNSVSIWSIMGQSYNPVITQQTTGDLDCGESITCIEELTNEQALYVQIEDISPSRPDHTRAGSYCVIIYQYLVIHVPISSLEQ